MGVILPLLPKDIESLEENTPGFAYSEYNNADGGADVMGFGGIAQGASSLISNIIGYATGTTQAQAQAQQQMAAAQLAAAQSQAAVQESRRRTAITVAAILVGGAVILTGGYFVIRSIAKKK